MQGNIMLISMYYDSILQYIILWRALPTQKLPFSCG